MRNHIHATAEKQFNNCIQPRKRGFAEKDQSASFSFTLLLLLAFICPLTGIAQNTLDNLGLGSGSPSAAAFSLRKLSTAYGGPAIRVRRSSDNNQQDIAFTAGGRIDTTALKTFVGTGSGYITTWYDQSGFGKNATQATTTKQPRIVNAGVVDLQNGKPAIVFSGGQNLQTSLTGVQASTGGNTTTANFVFKNNTANTAILSNADGGTNRYLILAPWGDGNTYFDMGNNGSGGRLSGALTWTGMSVGTFQRNNTQGNIWKNGASMLSSSTFASTVTSTNSMYIGSYDASNYYINGVISEITVFSSALSTTDRQIMECNQFSFYGITETSAPVITCPATQTLNLSASCSATLPSYTSLATVSDNCTASSSIVVTQSPAAGTVVTGAGIQAITLTATDAAGNSSSCSFNIYKQDVTAPVISCPSNITTTVDAGTCGAVVNYTITATDDCSGANCAPASISGYTLIGTYNGHVYFRSNTTALWPTAKANAQALGAHLVTIASAGEKMFLAGLGAHWGGMTDEVTEGTWLWVTGEPVVYTSWNPGEPNNSGGNQDYLVLNYSGTNWDDQGTTTTTLLPYIIEFDCLSINMVSGLASGSTFPLGTTTVTYNASDNAGNVSPNCSFTVTVTENIAPVISCPATQILNLGASCSATLPNYTTLATKSDNCTPTASIVVTQSPAAGTVVSNSGTLAVTLTATDASGNSSSCTFNVTKTDATPPVITCPAAQTINLNASCSAILPDYTSLATATDNCTSGLTIVQSPAPGTVVNTAGTILITLSATDAAGNTGNCTFNLTKRDVTPPVMNCPANITTTVTPGMCGAIVNYTVGATDNCSAMACAPSSITGYTALGTFNGHTYFRSNSSVPWATANSNAVALGAHLVTISSAAENAFFAGLGSHWTGFTDQAVEGTWVWVTGEPVVYTSWAAGEPNDYGGNEDYMQLNWSGTDWNDNSGSSSYPYIIEYDCMPVTMITGYASGSLFPVGTTTVTYNATDAAGNTSADCSFTVTVTDNVAPVISCPANISVTAAAGACTAVVNYATPTATDNCGSCSSAPAVAGYTTLGIYNGNAYYISTGTANATTAFAAAASMGGVVASVSSASENTFIRNAANAAGYTGSYYIGFNDATTEGTFVWSSGEPVIYTNWNAGEPNNSGNEDYTIVYNTGLWNDINVSTLYNYVVKVPCITPVKTSGLASGSTFPVGVSTINYSATDASGNTSTCSFTVTVSLNTSSTNKTVAAAATAVCSGGSTNITVALSDVGVTYQLRDNATNTNIGTAVAGTGGTISLPTGTLSATTTFNILTTNTSAGCSFQLTNTSTVTVNPLPSLPSAGNNSRCGTGTVTITATPGTGVTIDWYSAASGGTLLLSGNTSYTTPSISSTTIYYAQARNSTTGCLASSRTAVTATVASTPASPAAGNNSRCGTGTVTITATPGVGETIDWYTAASGGTLLLSGNTSYTTTSISATTVYYAQARNIAAGCLAAARTAVTATVNALPTDKTPVAVSATLCSGGSTTIQIAASQSGVSYQLRNNTDNISIGTAVAGTGASINLPTGALSATTTFNVLATNTTTSCNVQMINTVTVTVNTAGQWIGGTTGDWNNASNWCGGIPSASTSVNIPAGTTVNIQTANATANNISIASTASLVMTGAYNLNITAGGTFTNNGTFTATASTGTVAFLGNGTISGTTTFKNIDTYGALDFGTASTVSGTFSIQTGGSVTGHSPFYTCPSSTLLYKPGTVYNRGLEWTTASSGAGYPANVVVQNNTTINFPAVGNGYVCYDVQIEAGSSLKQNYSGGSASLSVGRNITINGTLELGTNSGGDISLGGNWTRNTGGVFKANDRKVTFDGPSNFSGNGTTMSTITAPASSAKDNEGGFGGENFAHVWINKTNATDSVVLLSNITVNRELGLTKGTLSLRNSDVTLVSNSTRTADVAPVTTPANVTVRYAGTGKFVVQRFIQNPTATRSWRLLTAPLQSATAPSINAAYMEGVVNPDRLSPNAAGGIYNPWPGYGTHITGPGGAYSAGNGFDQGTNSSSILYANAGVTSWLSPASTIATKVTDQQGWMLFVRGDRSFTIGDQYTPSQNTTLEPKGRINIGNVVIPVAAGRQVIGNPYPSAISLLDVNVAGTLGRSGSYHMWDPKMFTSYTQPGKWVSFTGIGTSFVQTTSASAYPSNGTIESGQAFLMDVASAGNITFHESDKLPLTSSLVGIANATGARPSANPIFPMIRSDIYAKSDSTYRLTDGVLNIFNADFDNAANNDDAKKIITFNTKESLSILRDSVKMAIEKRSDLQHADTIFFAMSKFNELPYRFRFEASDFAPGYEAFLEDRFTGSRTPLNINGISEVDFNITADPLSKAENRFRIVFRSSYIVLPVTFTNVKAWQQTNNIAVQWNIANETNIRSFDVEKSVDGSHFSKVNTTPSLGNFSGNRSYNWLDENAVTGDNYYRIVSKGQDATSAYSQVVKVNMAGTKGSISLLANPVTDGTIRLNFKAMEKGEYAVRLLTDAGQLSFANTINHQGGSAVHHVAFHQKMNAGVYNLEIITGTNKTVLKLIIQ